MNQKMMETDRMLHKANQIALNFAAYPRPQAIAGIADHIHKFWSPMMREQIAVHAEAGGEGLHELALEAVKALRR